MVYLLEMKFILILKQVDLSKKFFISPEIRSITKEDHILQMTGKEVLNDLDLLIKKISCQLKHIVQDLLVLITSIIMIPDCRKVR